MKKSLNYSIVKILVLLIVGLLAIITPSKCINSFHIGIYLSLLFYSIYQIIISLKMKVFSYFNLIFALINVFLIITISLSPNFYCILLPTILGIYILIIGLARLLTIFIYKSLPESRLNILINSLVHFVFSLILFISPTGNIKSSSFIIGIYLIALGISYIPKGSRHNNNIKIVEIPLIFQSLKPYMDFIKIDFEHSNNKKSNIEVDIEILIHVRRNKRGVFGHSDIIYKNRVYSYGNYDTSTYKLKDAIGEGVLIVANKEQYIKYCKSYGKSLFSFGIKLSDMEKMEIEKNLKNIMDKTYVFDKKMIVKDSYIDKLNKNVDVTFYKFTQGYYKHYFFLNYNCVKFIEEFMTPNLVDFTSIKTPGSLYTQLEEEYNSKDSRVVNKIIY